MKRLAYIISTFLILTGMYVGIAGARDHDSDVSTNVRKPINLSPTYYHFYGNLRPINEPVLNRIKPGFSWDCSIEQALSFENSLIGINNRNLDTLEVSLNTTVDLVKIVDSHKNPLVCESGIKSVDDIENIIVNSGIYNFIIGESLLKSRDIGAKLKQLKQISL